MANFFTDNDDIQFLFDHLNLAELAAVQEDDFTQNAGPGSEYARSMPPMRSTIIAGS